MRLLHLLTPTVLWVALAVPAQALDLPVRDPGRDFIEGPAYRADALELRLAPAASRRAAIAVSSERTRQLAGAGGRCRLSGLGLAAVDRVAANLGGARFEPEFRGEVPPVPGSDAPDLAAFFLVRLPSGASLEDALARFAALPEVLSAEPIAVLPVAAIPNDSLWTAAYWLFQPSRADIHAPEAWDVSMGDTSVVIAILDTGVSSDHPDIGGTTPGRRGQLWENPIEKNGVAGIDDDNNGFVDDIAGWDFVDLISSSQIPLGEDWDIEDPDPSDYAGHGTFAAGFAGAIPDNGIGLPGAAWNVRIMPVRMAWATVANPLGLVDMSFAAQAIHYAWRNGAHVINASWASLIQSGLDVAARSAMRAGVTIVSAAGNNGQPHELAEFEDVIAVAATDAFDQLAPFSNRGAWIDLSAPGTNMAGTFVVHAGTDSVSARTPSYIGGLSGTSFAAPLVSGAAALVHAHRRFLGMKPITPTGMRLRLRETSDDIGSINPGGGFGAGRLRLDRALTDGARSQALRTGAGMIGAPVALSTSAGGTRIVSAHQNQRLIMLDGQDGDTSWVATTPGVPTGHVAAADLGGGLGVGFFLGTSSGRIAGYDAHGAPLAGWPVTVPGVLVQPVAALGDLDGDGQPEVIANAGDLVVAYRLDGTPVSGFPVALFPPVQPVALAELDGQPGLEIVAAAGSFLYVIDGLGQIPAGWPVGVTLSQPPVVGSVHPFALPTILGVAGTQLHAFAPNGSTRWLPRPLSGSATAAPALGDFDGDGGMEIVVATNAPSLAVFDSLGQPLSTRNWPIALPSVVSGHPVIGPLDGTGGPSVLVFRSGGVHAFNDSARALAGYPRLGATGAAPTLAEIDADGRTEILAGTDSRALFYIHDAGPGTWAAPGGDWPTARGNFARTGTAGGAAAPVIDDPQPAAVGDLAVVATSDTSVTLQWTAVGEDGVAGRPVSYQLRADVTPISGPGFDAAPFQKTVSASIDAGGSESAAMAGLSPATTYWFAVRAVDGAGQRGALSNVPMLALGGGPLAGRDGVAIVSRAQPSRLPVEFFWKGQGGAAPGVQRIDLFDVLGRLIRSLPLDAAASGTATWDGRTTEAAAVRAGIYFARLVSGSFHAQARVVLLP